MKQFTILTYCSGYQYHVYQRFAGSLFETGYTGSLYFFIQRYDRPMLKKLQREFAGHDIHFIVCPWSCHLDRQTSRWLVYNKFLHKTYITCDYVLICDSRDILFQRDPASYPYAEHDDLYFFMEDTMVGACSTNTGWAKLFDSYRNTDLFATTKNQQVSCGGTTIGTPDGIRTYVKHMAKLARQLPSDHSRGLDQMMHMSLVYSNALNTLNTVRLNNDDNLINTLSASTCKTINANGQVINRHNEVSYIAHQYDRLPADLQRLLSPKQYNFSSESYRRKRSFSSQWQSNIGRKWGRFKKNFTRAKTNHMA